MGDQQATKRYKEILGKPSLPLVTVMSPRDTTEKALATEVYKARGAILKDLRNEGECDLRQVAHRYTGRNRDNARKAYRGLIANKPEIERITFLDNDIVRINKTLWLVNLRAPLSPLVGKERKKRTAGKPGVRRLEGNSSD